MLLSWHEHLAGLGRKHGVLSRTIFVGFDSFIPSSSLQSPLMYFILNSLEVVIGREADGADTLSR